MRFQRKERVNVADRQASADSGDTGPSDGSGFGSGFGSDLTAIAANVGTALDSLIGAESSQGSGLERVQQQDPLRGWKVASLRFSYGRMWFVPLNSQAGVYSADESLAVCAASSYNYSISLYAKTKAEMPHYNGPVLNCSCGFYAHKERAAAAQFGYALLEVDLYGTVIEHETGYRAEKQRVLSVTLGQRCYYCADAGVLLGLIGTEVPLLTAPVFTLCGAHAHLAPVTIERDHLSGLLGTEVRWVS